MQVLESKSGVKVDLWLSSRHRRRDQSAKAAASESDWPKLVEVRLPTATNN
jgi:hypothetical protein